MSEQEMIDWLHFFEFWRIQKSPTGRYMVTVGPVYDSTATPKASYETIYSRKNEGLCDLVLRLAETDVDIERRQFLSVTENTTSSLQLHEENAKLRAALRQARCIALASGVTMREYAKNLGITPAQLSAWTDETPNREPEFRD